MIKAIIFDVGGILTKYKEGSIQDYMDQKLDLKKTVWIKKIEPERTLLIKGKISQGTASNKIAKKLGIDRKKFEKILLEGYRKAHKKNFIMVNLARKLKRNYKIAILSNQNPLSDRVIKKFDFYKFFNPLVISYKVKARKPELSIYKIALKKLKLRPQKCVFIDDVEENILPAKKLGINTILFRNINQLKRDLKKLGVKI